MPGRLLGLLLWAIPLAAAANVARYPFSVSSVAGIDGSYQVRAVNEGPAPVWVRVSLAENRNMTSDVAWPIATLVPARTSLTLASLLPVEPTQSSRFRIASAFSLGDPTASPDWNAVYRLPFRGGPFLVSQAPGGRITTHVTPASEAAVDFMMPENTPILAARAGMVIDADLRHTRSGSRIELLDQANTVRILHDDGTIALYAHLRRSAPLVKTGDRVLAGEQIAWSGNTGFSSGPHLHFAVLRNVLAEGGRTRLVSLPVQFSVGGSVLAIQEGQKVGKTAGRSAKTAPITPTVASGRAVAPPTQAEPSSSIVKPKDEGAIRFSDLRNSQELRMLAITLLSVGFYFWMRLLVSLYYDRKGGA